MRRAATGRVAPAALPPQPDRDRPPSSPLLPIPPPLRPAGSARPCLRCEPPRVPLHPILQRVGQVAVVVGVRRAQRLGLRPLKAQHAQQAQQQHGRRGPHAALAHHLQASLCGAGRRWWWVIGLYQGGRVRALEGAACCHRGLHDRSGLGDCSCRPLTQEGHEEGGGGHRSHLLATDLGEVAPHLGQSGHQATWRQAVEAQQCCGLLRGWAEKEGRGFGCAAGSPRLPYAWETTNSHAGQYSTPPAAQPSTAARRTCDSGRPCGSRQAGCRPGLCSTTSSTRTSVGAATVARSGFGLLGCLQPVRGCTPPCSCSGLAAWSRPKPLALALAEQHTLSRLLQGKQGDTKVHKARGPRLLPPP